MSEDPKAPAGFVRREITTQREKDYFKGEFEEDAARIAEEKATEKAAAIARADLLEKEAHPNREDESNWKPPLSMQDFVRSISLAHPDWPILHTRRLAAAMWNRYEAVRAALLAGLAQGRKLREQSQYGHGWWWDELKDLTPVERGQVLDQVKRVVCK